MERIAHFYFHHSLNDFLRPALKQKWIKYLFQNQPSVKDAIEAIGIPHTEVDCILINNQLVNFSTPLHAEDKVEVYPFHSTLDVGCTFHTSVNQIKFVLDVHLGALARTLRLLGFDVLYQNNFDDKTIAQIAKEDGRIVLTRDINLLKQKIIERGYWLRSQMPDEQAVEVIRRYRLEDEIRPFERCIACNGMLQPAVKDEIKNLVPANTLKYFDTFYQCDHCKRVFWKGSHFAKMQQKVEKIKGLLKSFE